MTRARTDTGTRVEPNYVCGRTHIVPIERT